MTPFRRRLIVILCTVPLILLIYWGDILVRDRLRLGMFYLVPVLIATWFEGSLWGMICAGATVILRMTLETAQGATGLPVALFHQTPFIIVAGIAMFGFRHMRRTQDALHHLATRDHLTGLLNSSAFTRHMELELQRSRRYPHPGALIFLDLDNFKELNDSHGHHTGDAVLRLVADAIQRAVRGVDVVGRMGGDEFAVLMPETEGTVAVAAARRLNDGLRATFDGTPPISASIGVVSFGATPLTADELLRRADQAMYEAKRMGKNRVVQVAL